MKYLFLFALLASCARQSDAAQVMYFVYDSEKTQSEHICVVKPDGSEDWTRYTHCTDSKAKSDIYLRANLSAVFVGVSSDWLKNTNCN